MEKPRPPFIIEDLIPDPIEPGYIIIGGREGTGKTQFALQMAYAVASGELFLGLKTRRTVVAYLDLESSQYDLVQRTEKLERMYPTARDYIRCQHLDPLRLPTREQDFRRLIKGAELVILDNLQLAVAGNPDDPGDAKRFIDSIKQISQKEKVFFVLIHHLRKKFRSNGRIMDTDADDIRGPSIYKDLATTNILFEETAQPRDARGNSRPKTPDEQNSRQFTFWKVRLGKKSDAATRRFLTMTPRPKPIIPRKYPSPQRILRKKSATGKKVQPDNYGATRASGATGSIRAKPDPPSPPAIPVARGVC
ncbi:MAG: AAA family ATPase [Thermoplasmata archaeon]